MADKTAPRKTVQYLHSRQTKLADELISLTVQIKDAKEYVNRADFLRSELTRLAAAKVESDAKLEICRLNTEINTTIMNSRVDNGTILIGDHYVITMSFNDVVPVLKRLYKERDDLLNVKYKNIEIATYYSIVLNNLPRLSEMEGRLLIAKKEKEEIDKALEF